VGERGRLPGRGPSWLGVQAVVPGRGAAEGVLSEPLAPAAGGGRCACALAFVEAGVPAAAALGLAPSPSALREAPWQFQCVAAPHRREAEPAPAASKSLVQPAARASPRRPQGAPLQLETNGSGHASTLKSRSRGMSPRKLSKRTEGALGQNTQARLLPRVLTKGTLRPNRPHSVSIPPPPGRVNPCPTPTH